MPAKDKGSRGRAQKLKHGIKINGGVYAIGDLIASGGFGSVYKGLIAGESVGLKVGSLVAIKAIELMGVDEAHQQSIEAETSLLKRLSHHHVVKYIDAFADFNHMFIVLELVEGGSLQATLDSYGSLAEHVVAQYMYQVLLGLQYLHTQGVIHRDIKAANILITKSGDVKITDFGVSFDSAHTFGHEETFLGTPYWMAPEIILDQTASPKSDIWSFACTIIELLSGKPPYFDLAQQQAMARIASGAPIPMPAGMSTLCRDLLARCLHSQPELRPSIKKLLEHGFFAHVRQQLQAAPESHLAPVTLAPASGTKATSGTGEATRATIMTQLAGRKLAAAPIDISDAFVEASSSSDDWGSDIDESRMQGASGGSQSDQGGSPMPSIGLTINSDDSKNGDGALIQPHVAELTLSPRRLPEKSEESNDSNWGDGEQDDADQSERHALERVQREVEQHLQKLQHAIVGERQDSVESQLETLGKLVRLVHESPIAHLELLRPATAIPIIELLEATSPRVLFSALGLINLAVAPRAVPSAELRMVTLFYMEQICIVGGIPAVARFVAPQYPRILRLMAARFVSRLVLGAASEGGEAEADSSQVVSRKLREMFIACRGLPVLASMLNGPYHPNRAIILMGVQAIISLFRIKTHHSVFGRLMAKAGMFRRLMLALGHINRDRIGIYDGLGEPGGAGGPGELDEETILDKDLDSVLNPRAETPTCKKLQEHVEGLVHVFELLSSLDQVAKQYLAQVPVVKGLLLVFRELSPVTDHDLRLGILRTLKQLAMDPSAREALEAAGLIPVLIHHLSEDGDKVDPIHNHILHTLFQMMRVNAQRTEQAAMVPGFVARLTDFIRGNSPIRQFCIWMLVDIARASRRARAHMLLANGLELLMELIVESSWGSDVLKALRFIVQDGNPETIDLLASEENTGKIVMGFKCASAIRLPGMAETLSQMVSQAGTLTLRHSLVEHSEGLVPCLLDYVDETVESIGGASAESRTKLTIQVRNVLQVLVYLCVDFPNLQRVIEQSNMIQRLTEIKAKTKEYVILQLLTQKLWERCNSAQTTAAPAGGAGKGSRTPRHRVIGTPSVPPKPPGVSAPPVPPKPPGIGTLRGRLGRSSPRILRKQGQLPHDRPAGKMPAMPQSQLSVDILSSSQPSVDRPRSRSPDCKSARRSGADKTDHRLSDDKSQSRPPARKTMSRSSDRQSQGRQVADKPSGFLQGFLARDRGSSGRRIPE